MIELIIGYSFTDIFKTPSVKLILISCLLNLRPEENIKLEKLESDFNLLLENL